MLGFALSMVAACGIFVAAEFAFVTVSRSQVERAVGDGVRGAVGVQSALRSLSTQLSGAQVGITVTNLAIGYLAEPSIAALLRPPLSDLGLGVSTRAVSLTLAIALATVLTMLFGELVPKNLAIANPFAVARAVQLPQRVFTATTKPLTASLNRLANVILRRFGVEPQEELASAHSPSELVALIGLSADAGAIERPVATLVQGSLRLDDKLARDVMTPRTTMLTLDADEPVQRMIDLTREHGVSRVPVMGDDVDHVVGLVELSQVVKVPATSRRSTTVGSIAGPVLTVPDSLPLDDLLWALQDHRSQLALTLDEYGGTAGLVTFEDIVEELVGEVNDEHDRPQAAISEVDSRTLRVSGLVRPDELQDQQGVCLPEGEQRYDTVAGLVMEQLGRVPATGDVVDVDGVRLEVDEMDGHRIDWLRVRRAPEPPTESSDE